MKGWKKLYKDSLYMNQNKEKGRIKYCEKHYLKKWRKNEPNATEGYIFCEEKQRNGKIKYIEQIINVES